MARTAHNGDPPGALTRVRVLIADDDLGQRTLLKHWIERHGSFDVAEEAADGVEAVDAAVRLHPQVAVLDLAMPRMDGLEAAAEIRRLLPETRIVIRSGFTAERMAQKAIDAGADVYVEKAAQRSQLLGVLEELAPTPDRAVPRPREGAGPDEVPAQVSFDDLLLDGLDVGVLRVDGSGHVRSANFQAALALGVPTSHLVDSSLTELLGRARPEGGLDAGVGASDPVSTAFETGRPQSGRMLRLERPDESSVWLSVNVRPAGGEDVRASGAVVVVRDVTEEHRLREVVQDGYDRLSRLLDAVPAPVAVLRARPGEGTRSRDFVVAHANRAARARTAWTAGSRVDRDAVGAANLQSIGNDEVLLTWSTMPAAGSRFEPAQPSATTQLLEAALVSSPVGAVLLDASARLVIANPVADRLLGGTSLLGGGPSVRVLRRADTKQPVPEEDLPVRAACAGAAFDDMDLFVADEEGSGAGTYLRVSGRPVFDAGGEPAGAVISVFDDTATKKAQQALAETSEELRRSNTELANFASIASHDLSQPLQKIYGFAQLLQEGDLDDEQVSDYVGRIVAGGERMRTLIDDLLTYSRLTSEARPFEPVDLAVVVQEVLELFEQQIANDDARVDVGPLPVVVGDRIQMSQLFQNLIGNALTYVAGGVRPVIRIRSSREDGEWQITVVDNGIGIRPEDRERAFGMFQRLVSADDYPGTGIGLAVCAKITERHGGRIWIDGNPDGGSSISLALPDRSAG